LLQWRREEPSMTTDEAIRLIDDAPIDDSEELIPQAWQHIKAALARVTAERDRLIEAWPTVGAAGLVYENMAGTWNRVLPSKDGEPTQYARHDTRLDAVRAAAGLDAMEGA
jgi:hypothetical protein